MVTRYIVVKDIYIAYDDISRNMRGDIMADKSKWVALSQSILKAELKRRNIGYRELAEKLTAMGTPETDRNIANKISRGGFTAAFFVECLIAIGCQTVRLTEE
jgi:hypothetical protein